MVWIDRETTTDAVNWLRDNASALNPQTCSEAVEAALAFQRHRIDDILPVVGTLDRNERTWNVLRNLAGLSLVAVPYSREVEMGMPTRELFQLRPLLNQLNPPDELRQQIEDAYARRSRSGE